MRPIIDFIRARWPDGASRSGVTYWPHLRPRMFVALLALAIVPAYAQPTPAPKAEPKDEPGKSAVAQKPAPKKTAPKLRVSPPPKPGCGSEESGTVVPSAPTDGTAPKWSCEKTTVTIEPVWQGKQIECPFILKNEGDADLHIKASGG